MRDREGDENREYARRLDGQMKIQRRRIEGED